MEEQIKALEGKADEAYLKARDAVIAGHRDRLAMESPVPGDRIPDLRAALAVRAKHPERSERFTGALTGTNVEFLNPNRLSRKANGAQIAAYLGGFPADFLPLAEEYLFHLPSAFASASILGLALYYRDGYPDRGGKAAAECFRHYAGNAQAQQYLMGMLETLRLVSSSPDIWNAYRTTDYAPLRHFAQFLLAEFQDAEMRRELERLLSAEKTAPADREAAVSAYANYFPGTQFDKHVEIYRRFQLPETRLVAAQSIDPTDDAQAKTTRSLIQGTDEKTSPAARNELQANLDEFIHR